MKAGDAILISAPGRGEANGEIDILTTPDNLPGIPGAPDVEQVRAIMAEGEITEIAFLTYDRHDGSKMGMFAFHRKSGEWRDLRGQLLTIRPAPRPS